MCSSCSGDYEDPDMTNPRDALGQDPLQVLLEDAARLEPIRVMLWTGGDAPNREAKLSVTVTFYNTFFAYWEPGYCGCEDCHPVTGEGATKEEAIAAYWEAWEEKYAACS